MKLFDYEQRIHSIGLANFLCEKQRAKQIGVPTAIVPSEELFEDDYIEVDTLIGIEIMKYNLHKKNEYFANVCFKGGEPYFKIDPIIARIIRSLVNNKEFLITLEHVDYNNHLFKLVAHKRRPFIEEEEDYEVQIS